MSDASVLRGDIPEPAHLRLSDGHNNGMSDERGRRQGALQRQTDARQAIHDTRRPRHRPATTVIAYYKYLWQRTKGVEPQQLFLSLPRSIWGAVSYNLYGELIRWLTDHAVLLVIR